MMKTMEKIKTLGEIRKIIEKEKEKDKRKNIFTDLEGITYVGIDTEKNNLIYKVDFFISMNTLEKLKDLLIQYNYGYIISKSGEIIIFPLILDKNKSKK